MSVLVKICGITNLDDALDAVELGADFLGFNFYPDSKRYIEPEAADDIIQDIPSSVKKVGVFVNEQVEKVIDLAVALELDFVQFHGDETADYCNAVGRPWLKAFRLKEEKDLEEISKYESPWLLVDSYVEKAFGGTGIVSNWDLAREAKKYGELFLSGGLNPDNIATAIQSVQPYAVDVASGVESAPGIKDRTKLEKFIAIAKAQTLRPKIVS
ncbi:phosphoribosylanthranilate isomerase [bacterium]|nr:phosphoribosylanthranilate isomerase [bacterium]